MFDWERIWRGSGIQFSVLFILAYVISGSQPKVGASADQLVAFYDGHRMRILMAGMLLGFAVLGLLWFGAALSSVLRDAAKAAGRRRRPPPAPPWASSTSCTSP